MSNLCWDMCVRLGGPVERRQVEAFLDTHLTSWRSDEVWMTERGGALLEACLAGEQCGETFYSPSVADPAHTFVMVAFGIDGGVVLGLAVEMGDGEPDEDSTLPLATTALDNLLRLTGALEGFGIPRRFYLTPRQSTSRNAARIAAASVASWLSSR